MEQANGFAVKPSALKTVALVQSLNDRRSTWRLSSGAIADACRHRPCLAGSLLAVLICVQAGPSGVYAADFASGSTLHASPNISGLPKANSHKEQHLIDFNALGPSPVYRKGEHEAIIERAFKVGVDEAFHALGQIKAADRLSAEEPPGLRAQNPNSVFWIDRRSVSALPGDALRPSSFGPVLSWLASTNCAGQSVCNSTFPGLRRSFAELPYDNVKPGSNGESLRNDLLSFAFGRVDDIWAFAREANGSVGSIDVSLNVLKPSAQPFGLPTRQDRNNVITRAAFAHPASDNGIDVRRAIAAPIVPNDRRRVSALASDVGVRLAVSQDIYSLSALAPPSLVLRDAGREKREKALVFDNDWILANRLKVPLGNLSFSAPDEDSNRGAISLVPFLDTGIVWNAEAVTYPIASDPFGIGAGIGWQITDATDLRLGIDIPVGGDEVEGADDPSELGFQFRLATTLGD